MIRAGARVRVSLPPDVESWTGEIGRCWLATVVAVNGDSIDVCDDAGEIEPVDREYVRHVFAGAKKGDDSS